MAGGGGGPLDGSHSQYSQPPAANLGKKRNHSPSSPPLGPSWDHPAKHSRPGYPADGSGSHSGQAAQRAPGFSGVQAWDQVPFWDRIAPRDLPRHAGNSQASSAARGKGGGSMGGQQEQEGLNGPKGSSQDESPLGGAASLLSQAFALEPVPDALALKVRYTVGGVMVGANLEMPRASSSAARGVSEEAVFLGDYYAQYSGVKLVVKPRGGAHSREKSPWRLELVPHSSKGRVVARHLPFLGRHGVKVGVECDWSQRTQGASGIAWGWFVDHSLGTISTARHGGAYGAQESPVQGGGGPSWGGQGASRGVSGPGAGVPEEARTFSVHLGRPRVKLPITAGLDVAVRGAVEYRSQGLDALGMALLGIACTGAGGDGAQLPDGRMGRVHFTCKKAEAIIEMGRRHHGVKISNAKKGEARKETGQPSSVAGILAGLLGEDTSKACMGALGRLAPWMGSNGKKK